MKKIRLMLLSLVAVFTFAMPAVVVHAAVIGGNDGGNKLQEGACSTTGQTGDSCVTNGDAQKSFTDYISQIVDIFSIIVGAVSVIMIIVGGFRYIISGGDSGNVSSAKNTIMYAIIGLIIVALAQVIVNFVLKVLVK